jgi:hypothetical protein
MNTFAESFEHDLSQFSNVSAQLDPMHGLEERNELYWRARVGPSKPMPALECVNDDEGSIAETEARI